MRLKLRMYCFGMMNIILMLPKYSPPIGMRDRNQLHVEHIIAQGSTMIARKEAGFIVSVDNWSRKDPAWMNLIGRRKYGVVNQRY